MLKNILALNFSGRKNGNCSIAMNEVLRPCRNQDFNIELVNVALLNIRSCTGCFGCNNGELRCTIHDDLESLKEKIEWSDVILIVSPCYTFSAPGVMKNVLDRSAAWAFEKIESAEKSRIGISISIGGAPEQWNLLQRVFPGIFLKLFNCDVLYQSVFRGIGLRGEILLHPDILQQIHQIGEGVVQAVQGNETAFPIDANDQDPLVCPCCKADVFHVCQDGVYTCAVCGTEIKRDGFLKKQLSMGKFNLYSPEAARIHANFVGGKILNGMEASEEVNRRLQAYLEKDFVPQSGYVPTKNSTDLVSIEWDSEGMREFERVVPKMFQTFVRKAVERKAYNAGYKTVTKEIFLKIKRESGN